MIDFKHLQGNIIISASGVGLSFLSKKIGGKEFLPVSSVKQAALSFTFFLAVTIFGKKVMDTMASRNIIKFEGKEKKPNEGFIGPLKNETIGPKN